MSIQTEINRLNDAKTTLTNWMDEQNIDYEEGANLTTIAETIANINIPNVLNAYSDSQTDVYSCNYVNTHLVDLFYPVGSYYETSDDTFNPNTSWGGTWELETDGTALVSKSSTTESKFNVAIGTIVGSETHKLTKAELPKIDIETRFADGGVSGGGDGSGLKWGTKVGTSTNALIYNTNYGGKEHNIVQPSKVINRWHRTA